MKLKATQIMNITFDRLHEQYKSEFLAKPKDIVQITSERRLR